MNNTLFFFISIASSFIHGVFVLRKTHLDSKLPQPEMQEKHSIRHSKPCMVSKQNKKKLKTMNNHKLTSDEDEGETVDFGD